MNPQVSNVLDRAREAAAEKLKRKPTLTEIGRLAGGIKQPSVSEWRDGMPSLATARTFAKNVGACVEWLLTGRGPKHPWDIEDETVDPQLTDLRRVWEALDRTARQELINFAHYLEHKNAPMSAPAARAIARRTARRPVRGNGDGEDGR